MFLIPSATRSKAGDRNNISEDVKCPKVTLKSVEKVLKSG